MKCLSLVLACGIAISACGGSNDSTAPASAAATAPPMGLEGMWRGSSISDVTGTYGTTLALTVALQVY